MKKFILSLLISGCSIDAFAQTVIWDSTFRPNNYVQRVEYFRSYPNSDKDIIFLGNSITDYTDWNELLECRDWWLPDQYTNLVRYLSIIDLLKMRAGIYTPYWK